MSREIFSSITAVRASSGVVKQIKAAILEESFKPGDRLSSEMELARIFQTSRATVREALRVLEKEGFLEIRQGVKGGSYVREADFTPIVNSLSMLLQRKKITFKYLTEVRLLIEPEIARLASERATKADIKRMEEALEALRSVVERRERSTMTNLSFHRAIGEGCKNPAFYFINESLMNLLHESLSRLTLKLENNRHLLAQHIQIFEAIKARDGEKARAKMREHVLWVRKTMKRPAKGALLSTYEASAHG